MASFETHPNCDGPFRRPLASFCRAEVAMKSAVQGPRNDGSRLGSHEMACSLTFAIVDNMFACTGSTGGALSRCASTLCVRTPIHKQSAQ
jgi:hypothetical protein